MEELAALHLVQYRDSSKEQRESDVELSQSFGFAGRMSVKGKYYI